MKELCIKILSLLVNTENKIQIKKTNINFKEGFNRIVIMLLAWYLIIEAISIFNNEYKMFSDFIYTFFIVITIYLGYLFIVYISKVLFKWIWAGFTSNTRKRSLLKEWQIKYKYWNRTCKRMGKKYDKEHLEQENYIEYNRNPFVPKGRMKRLDCFIYSFIFNFIEKGIDSYIGLHPGKVFISFRILFVILLILGIFITRNRIYDITLSDKKAWWLSILFQLSAVVLSLISPSLIYLLVPFGIALMVIPSKIEKEDDIKNIKVKEQSAFDIAREIHKKEK